MGEWHRNNPELAEEIAALPPSQQIGAERALIPDPFAAADDERKRRREEGDSNVSPSEFMQSEVDSIDAAEDRALRSPQAIRRQEWLDRMNDEMLP